MTLIRRGIHLDTHGVDDGAAVFGRLAEAARAAEDAGFDTISVPDHIYDPGGPALPMFEAYTVLGALAAVSSSATLLTLASPVTLRAPGLLAKAVTTLDVIVQRVRRSGGRPAQVRRARPVLRAGRAGPRGDRQDRGRVRREGPGRAGLIGAGTGGRRRGRHDRRLPDDPARIAAIGQILAESFPG